MDTTLTRRESSRPALLTCLMALFLMLPLTGCEWELFDKDADTEEDDDDTHYEPVERGEADEAWITYIVGQKR